MHNGRPSKDEYFINMAFLAAKRATCARRQVGCILVNAHGHVLATGYNGPPARVTHCIDVPCGGVGLPSGQGLDVCQAVHAEQNAMLQCPDVYSIETAYITTSPCITCTKLLMNTSCRRIVFSNEYSHGEEPKKLWQLVGRQWEQYKI